MIKVSVPASSANLGSGTDCVGVALPLYLRVMFDYAGSFEIIYNSGDDPKVALQQDLIYIAVRKIYRMAKETMPNLRITVDSGIPLCSGMGSSAAAIVAGLCGANALLGQRFSKEQLAAAACEIEGHPDNVVASLAGGFTVSAAYEGRVHYSTIKLDDGLAFIAAVPQYHLSTKAAREVLPKEIPLQTALTQLQHGCYLVSVMQQKRYGELAAATRDAVCTPMRKVIIKGYEEVTKAAVDSGAYCALISGAGPSIIALAKSGGNCAKIASAMNKAFTSVGLRSEVYIMNADNDGAQTEGEI